MRHKIRGKREREKSGLSVCVCDNPRVYIYERDLMGLAS